MTFAAKLTYFSRAFVARSRFKTESLKPSEDLLFSYELRNTESGGSFAGLYRSLVRGLGWEGVSSNTESLWCLTQSLEILPRNWVNSDICPFEERVTSGDVCFFRYRAILVTAESDKYSSSAHISNSTSGRLIEVLNKL